MSPILLAIVVIALTITLFKKWQLSRFKQNYPPGPPRLPFIGSYLHVLWSDFYKPHQVFTKWKDFYGSPVISWGMGSFNVVVANDYATCKEVLTNPHLQGRVPAYPALHRTYGQPNGYFTDDTPRWQTMKRTTLRGLRDMGLGRRSAPFESVMEEEVQALMQTLRQSKSEPVLLPQVFFHTMINLINEIVYGFRYSNEHRHVLTETGNMSMQLLSGTDATGRLIAIWPWIRFIFPEWSGETELQSTTEYFQSFIGKFLKKKKENMESNIDDFMAFMVDGQKRFPDWTDEEIISSVMDITFPNAAASFVLAFTLGYLVNNPEKLKKCQEEIDTFVGRERLPNLEDRNKLKMVEGSIRETMRIQPLVPSGLPHRATEDTTLGGYFVPKESLIIANQHAMNHDPNLFPEPHLFLPERFSNGRDDTFSFGLGKRVCVGETFVRQNMFVVIASILQNFDLEIGTNMDPERFVYGASARPNPDFALKFIPRS